MRLNNLTGKKLGKLTVITRAEDHVAKGRKYVKWTCKCECGTVKDILAANIKKLTSCGCVRNKKASDRFKAVERVKLKKGEASFNILYNRYKHQAKRRKRTFKLTKKEFSILTSGDCYYCGTEPNQEVKGKRTNGSYIYNGIDREDNRYGYEYWNCVSCCKICNFAKKESTQEEFFDWIERIKRL